MIDSFFQNLYWLRDILMLISAVLFVGVVYLIIKIDYFSDLRLYTLEILRFKNLPKKRTLKIWKHILHYVSTPNPDLWKEAVVTADNLFDEILKLSGYIGKNIEERLDQVDSSQVYNIEDIKKIRSQMMEKLSDPEYVIELSKAKEFLRIYRQAFRQLGLIE